MLRIPNHLAVVRWRGNYCAADTAREDVRVSVWVGYRSSFARCCDDQMVDIELEGGLRELYRIVTGSHYTTCNQMGKEKLQLEIEIAFHWELSHPVGAREGSWI